jgi:hypothetical protein
MVAARHVTRVVGLPEEEKKIWETRRSNGPSRGDEEEENRRKSGNRQLHVADRIWRFCDVQAQGMLSVELSTERRSGIGLQVNSLWTARVHGNEDAEDIQWQASRPLSLPSTGTDGSGRHRCSSRGCRSRPPCSSRSSTG